MSVTFESTSHSTLVAADFRPDLQIKGLDVGSANNPMPRIAVLRTGMVFSQVQTLSTSSQKKV